MRLFLYISLIFIVFSDVRCKLKKEITAEIPADTIFLTDMPIEKKIIDTVETIDSSQMKVNNQLIDTSNIVIQSDSLIMHAKDTTKVELSETTKQSDTSLKVETGVYFRVQLAASNHPLVGKNYNNIDGISNEQHNGFFKYVTKAEKNLFKVIALQNTFRNKGIKDAWVVSYLDENRISMIEAKQYLKGENISNKEIIADYSKKSSKINEPESLTVSEEKIKPDVVPKRNDNEKPVESLVASENDEELEGIEMDPIFTNIQKAIEVPEKVEKLDLSNQNLTEFPLEIIKLTNLQSLNLYGNNLKELPDSLEKMNKLRVVGLGKNTQLDFTETFIKLSKLPQLEELYLSFNNMSELPPEIGELDNLKSLVVYHNQITSIPKEIGNLTKLEKLGFSYCLFTVLPPEFENLQNLEEVYLLTNNELNIEDAVKILGKLKKLKKLHFYDNRLIYLPRSIGNLTSLEELDLGSNQLSFLPKEVDKLVNLKVLNISGNQLSEVPAGIELIPNLEELLLNFNLLSTFPGKVALFKNLKKLDLGINKITKCPAEISKLQNLEWVNLRGNKISEKEMENFKKSLPNAKIIF